MTRQAAQAAGAEALRVPLLAEHERTERVAVLLVTGDRGLAGGFNSQIIRAGIRLGAELAEQSLQGSWYVAGRRGASSMTFRGYELSGTYTGFFGPGPPTPTRGRSPPTSWRPTSTVTSTASRSSTTPTSRP